MEPVLFYSTQVGPIWDWRVVVDLFAGGIGVGAVLFSVALSRYGDRRYLRLAQTGAVIAPFLVMFGLLFLFWKLGNKLNVYQMAINIAPTSVMWWGFLLQSALVALGLIYAWQWRNISPNAGRDKLGLLVALLALLVGIYHGLLLATLTSHPLWASGSTILMAILAFVSTGIAGTLLTHFIRVRASGLSEEEQDLDTYIDGLWSVRNILAFTLVLILLNMAFWWVDLAYGSLQSRQALDAAIGSYGSLFWWFGIGLGVIIPIALLAMFVSKAPAQPAAKTISMVGLASILILVGGFCLRYVLVLGGQAGLPIATLT